MTGDIKKILLASDAANSMKMEARVADAFMAAKWPAERGMYYKDLITGKPREIDVYSKNIMQKPRRRRGIGAPLISIEVFCECKSLSGSNVIFAEGAPTAFSAKSIESYRIGMTEEIREIVSTFMSELNISDMRIWKRVYDYALDRAYSNDGRAVSMPMSMPAPPVDLIARAFRETKGGAVQERVSEGARQSPVWGAVLSSMSAVRAAKVRAREVCLSFIHAGDRRFSTLDEIIRSFSFFLDAELMRTFYFHPVVVIDAPLWRIERDEISELNSVRLCIGSIDDWDINVDIVRYSHIDQYVANAAGHFDKYGKQSILGLWNWIDKVGWHPGGEEADLRAAIKGRRTATVDKSV